MVRREDGKKKGGGGKSDQINCQHNPQTTNQSFYDKKRFCQEFPGQAEAEAGKISRSYKESNRDRKRDHSFHVFFRREHAIGDGKHAIERENREDSNKR